jgi:glycosyltransferase involved in cell wall biosynthesis
VREVAVRERLCRPDRIKVLGRGSGNGVDAAGRFDPGAVGPGARREIRSALGIGDGELVIGFVGRITRDKGVVELMDAWRHIRQRTPQAHLVIVGRFEPHAPLPSESRQAMTADARVHLSGTTREIPRWYAAMDLVVLPSYREGFPNVVLEAAAMRLPVVATRVPGCVDAVDAGRTGVLVPPRDTHALVTAIDAYLSDADLRRRHGTAGRRRVLADYRPEGIWQALHQEYVGLLTRAGAVVERRAA